MRFRSAEQCLWGKGKASEAGVWSRSNVVSSKPLDGDYHDPGEPMEPWPSSVPSIDESESALPEPTGEPNTTAQPVP